MRIVQKVRPATLLLLVIILLWITPAVGNPFTAAQALARAGDGHFLQAEFTLALQLYQGASDALPKSPSILLRLASAAESLHRWQEARNAYTAASRYPWAEARAVAGLARIAAETGDSWQASRLWEEAVRLGGNEPDVLLGYVRFLWRRGAFGPCSGWTEEVLRLDPSNTEARYYAGVLALLEGDFAESEAHLALAAQDGGAALRSRATLLLSAVQDSAEAGSTDALLRVGVALLRAGEEQPACTLFRQAWGFSPDSPVAGAYWGYCLALDGNEAGARGVLRDVSARAPDYPLVWYFLGEVERRTGRPSEARPYYLTLLQLDPENSAACVALAETHIEENAFSEAEGWLLKAVELSPDDGQMWLTLAQFYVSRLVGVRDRGVAAAKTTVELLPDDAAAHDTLGWAYFLSNDSESALREVERALQLDDRSAAVQYHAGSVYYALGDREKARYHLTRAVDVEPEGRYAALAEDLLRRLED